MANDDRRQLLKRICPGDRSLTWQHDLRSARISNSSQWLLEDPKMKEWLNTPHILWVHGPSATGKTFLCSYLVDHLKTDHTTHPVAITCIYLSKNHRQYNLADFNYALTSVLRQLVSQLPDDSQVLQQFAEEDEMPYPGDDEFYKLLQQVASEFGKVFIVFDGADNVTASALRDLMLAINPNGSDPMFRVLFASRNSPPDGVSGPYQILDIPSRAQDKDVEQYIIQTLRDVSGKNLSSDHEELVQGLVRVFDGRFIPIPIWPVETPMAKVLASLQQLASTRSASISDRIDTFCRESLTQLLASKSKDMVLCILYHVIKATEAGYTFTMPMALQALDAWKIYQQDGMKFEASDVTLGYSGLVFYGSDESMYIQSPLLGDYLRREVFGIDFEKRGITASMRYLSSDTFAQGACTSSAALRERLEKNRYLWYAARMLSPTLAITVPETFIQDFMKLSVRRGSIESYLQAAEAWPYETQASYDELEEDQERWRCFTLGYTPLHLAAHIVASKGLIDALLARGEDLESRDNDGRTALHLAAEIEDDYDTIRALVGAGSSVSVEDNLGSTPLAIAIVNGSLASVKLLLEHGADLSELDEGTLEECDQEKPEIAAYLRELGLDVPVDVESDMEG